MGRKKIKNVLPNEIRNYSDKLSVECSQNSNIPEKKLIFEDQLLDNTQIENITIADIKRITSKTFDFLRTTGLRQTHISAITGINQSILSIILRDPGTKTISINRKKDVVYKLCEYYNKINLGLISHDPSTAPKISNLKKNAEINQKKRTLSRRNVSESELNNPNLSGSENIDHLNSDQYNRFELEKKNIDENREHLAESEGATHSLSESRKKLEDVFSCDKLKNILLFSSCIGCSVSPKKIQRNNKFLIEDFQNGPIPPFINDKTLIECIEVNSLCGLGGNQYSYNKNRDLTLKILDPILIPLTVNLRHFISSSSNDNYSIETGNIYLLPKSNSSAILSTLKGKNFKSEKFIWSSVSDPNTLWGFIENLSRERYLSIFMSNNEKKKVFNWLIKEIENYKSLYLQFLYLITSSNIKPGNNSLLICEIRLNESYEDVIVNDKFKWNISNPTNLLIQHVECLISDLNLPPGLFSELLYSALKQIFDEITKFVKRFNHGKNIYIANEHVDSNLYISNQYEDDASSNHSFGANCETRINDDNAEEESIKFVSYGNFVEWGDHADIEYDSDDNVKIFPTIENAEERRQMENKNRFRKKR